MLKKFAVTLIILSTVVYGSMFVMSKYYGTSFFDEILIQLNRMAVSFSNNQEVAQSKFILKTILDNDHPPAVWNGLIVHNQQNDHNELFYYYKIWTIQTKLSHEDINNSYPIFQSQKNHSIIINMRYGKTKPVVQFPFSRNQAGNLITGLFFPINKKPLSVDYNNDNKINHEDVVIARKKA